MVEKDMGLDALMPVDADIVVAVEVGAHYCSEKECSQHGI